LSRPASPAIYTLSLHDALPISTLAMAGLVQADTGVFGLVHWQTVVFARWLRLRQVSPGRSAGFWAWVDSQRGRRLHDTRLLDSRSEEHTSELQSRENLVCRLLL